MVAITLEALEQRRDELKGGIADLDIEIVRLQKNRAATYGAYQECEHWIERLKEEPAASTDAAPSEGTGSP